MSAPTCSSRAAAPLASPALTPRRLAARNASAFVPATAPLRQKLAGARRHALRVAVASAEPVAAGVDTSAPEFYEVFLDKPIGVKFARGKDGRAYVARTDPMIGNTSSEVTPGDKVVKVSASFGSDVWDALNYGQVVYAIKTRNGQVYLRMQRKYGDMSALEEDEETEAEKIYKAERSGGNYGVGTKEMQARNYVARKEAEAKRRQLFDEALRDFKGGKVEQALITFENVLAMEPKNYLGDNFSRVTQVARVTHYNIACCYSSLGQIDAGLDALKSALASGFEDYDKVRRDPNLAALRTDERFKPIIDAYDEPIINEGAIKALKSIFSFGKKD